MQFRHATLLVLTAASAPALAQLPDWALSEASQVRSQLLSFAGITSLAPAQASAEAAKVTSVASYLVKDPAGFANYEKNFSFMSQSTAAAARSTFIAFVEAQEPEVFGAAATTTAPAPSIATGAALPSSTNTASTMSTTRASQSQNATTSAAPSSTPSKGAAPSLSFSGALAVLGLAGAVLL